MAKVMTMSFLKSHPVFARKIKYQCEKEMNVILALLDRKGYFPYEYVTSPDVLLEGFPPLECFQNELRDEAPDEKRYKETLEVYEKLGCKNLGDYNILYIAMDVINIASIFICNCEMLKEYLHLDVYNFSSISTYAAACGTSKDRSLCTNIPNYNVMAAVEAASKGGYAGVFLRRAVVSDDRRPFSIKLEGVKKNVSSTVFIVDENNMYGEKMVQKLCQGGFVDITKELTYLDINTLIKDYETTDHMGYLISCDLKLPTSKHFGTELIYPSVFTKEQLEVQEISPYGTFHNRKKMKRPQKGEEFCKYMNTSKNMATFRDKKHEWCYIDTLKHACENGWVVTKVHKIYSYHQDYILKTYIEENTKRRMTSTCPVTI